MNALVTGGAGFIGSNLVKFLVEKNINVKIIDNLSTGNRSNILNLDVEFIKGDIRNYNFVLNNTRKVDVVFHLAASIGNVKSIKNPYEDSEVNLLGTINLLEAIKKNGVEKIIYSSSAAIYGELLYDEIDEKHPLSPNSPYGVSKLSAEKMVVCYSRLYNFTAVALRYFNVYGVNQRYDAYGNVIPIFAHRLLMRKPLTIYGDGKQTRDFVNVKDVALANYLASNKIKGDEVFNVGTGKSYSIDYLAQCMISVSKKNVEVCYLPPRKGEVLHCKADTKKIKDKLDFEPSVQFENGITEYLEWFNYWNKIEKKK